MSKIIEALKERSTAKEIVVERTGHDLTQEQLADIYFSATGRPKTSEVPVIIRVTEKSRAATLIPWIITFTAFLVTAATLFSTKRIFVDVKLIDEKSPYLRALQLDEAEYVHETTAKGSPVLTDKVSANRFSIQDFNFEGAAYLNSSKDRNGGLTLINSSVAPFARATLVLDPPLDLSRTHIVFYAKGGRGGENVAFSLRDKENIQGFYKGKIYPFPDRLSSSWQKAEIQVDLDTAKNFDAKNVTSLRFEFGSKDTGNKPGDTVFIKDLQWMTLKKELD